MHFAAENKMYMYIMFQITIENTGAKSTLQKPLSH